MIKTEISILYVYNLDILMNWGWGPTWYECIIYAIIWKEYKTDELDFIKMTQLFFSFKLYNLRLWFLKLKFQYYTCIV